MTTTIVTRQGKGSPLTFAELDANFQNLQASVDQTPVQTIGSDQTSSFTTTLAQAETLIPINSASAVTVTIPPSSSVNYAVGASISLLRKGAGTVAFAAGAGVTINTPSSLSARAQWSTIVVLKIATDTWVAAGDLT